MNLYKILKYVAALIGVIGIALMLWLLIVGPDDFKASADLQNSILNPFVFVAYFILGLATVSVLIFVGLKMISDGAKSSFISLGAFVVVFLIAFFAASSDEITYANGSHISSTGAKWMNTGINLFYILLILAVVAMIVSSVRNLTYRR